MAPHDPVVVPPQQRRRNPPEPSLAHVEREVARTAELVLRLTALADRYEAEALSDERVALMRETVLRGQQALADIAGSERLSR